MRRTDSREKISQDEIISNTKNVLRGLETLKNEHDGLLVKLSDKQRNGESDPTKRRETAEKMEAIEKSLEKIELGLGEAQVCFEYFIFSKSKSLSMVYSELSLTSMMEFFTRILNW